MRGTGVSRRSLREQVCGRPSSSEAPELKGKCRRGHLQLAFGHLEQPAVLLTEIERREKLRAPSPRQLELLPAPPACDALVISTEEDGRNALASELDRAGVLRVLQRSANEAFLSRRALVAEHPWLQPSHGVHYGERGQLSAGDDEIAERDLAVDMAAYPLVHPFVPSAYEDQAAPGSRQLASQALRQRHAARAHQESLPSRQTAPRIFDRGYQRLDLHHHSTATSVRDVIRLPVLTRRELADVERPHREQAFGASLAQDALGEVALHDSGEQRQDFRLQHG